MQISKKKSIFISVYMSICKEISKILERKKNNNNIKTINNSIHSNFYNKQCLLIL